MARRRALLVVAALCAVAAVVAAIAVGEPVDWSRALTDPTSVDHAIVFGARVPRVLLGLLVGAGLATTGAAYQGLLRNPLAEPYVLGVSGGAALGASIAIAVGSVLAIAPLASATIVAIIAAVSGGLATLLVWALAARATTQTGREDALRGHATSILLAGVVVNAIASGAITFVKTVVRASTAQQLLFWLAGFLDVPTPAALAVVAVAVTVGGALLVIDAPRLNLLTMGDEHAAHLGVDVRALERRVFLASSIVVGAVVATCGMIGFVGLLVPHVVRRLVGPDHRVVLPLSLAFGGATLVACDLIARATFRLLGTEPPVGAITALIGGPLFLVLLSRRRVG
ncbi:MAG: iron ABC transporter permease [Deltaproteobacteria bacterium]|nr:iron ABC transporter permease [Deltaproteobacteria bacterium]